MYKAKHKAIKLNEYVNKADVLLSNLGMYVKVKSKKKFQLNFHGKFFLKVKNIPAHRQ